MIKTLSLVTRVFLAQSRMYVLYSVTRVFLGHACVPWSEGFVERHQQNITKIVFMGTSQ